MSSHFLVEIAAKASIALAVAWFVTRLMARRSSAAARHLVWTFAFAAVLGLPVLVAFGPEWRVASVPERWMPGVRAAIAGPAVRTRSASDVWPDSRSGATHSPINAELGARSSETADASGSFQSAGRRWFSAWPALVIAVWATGVVIGLSCLLAGHLWAGWLARRAIPLTGLDWTVPDGDVKSRLGVKRRVPLLVSSRIAIPFTCGILRPS